MSKSNPTVEENRKVTEALAAYFAETPSDALVSEEKIELVLTNVEDEIRDCGCEPWVNDIADIVEADPGILKRMWTNAVELFLIRQARNTLEKLDAESIDEAEAKLLGQS